MTYGRGLGKAFRYAGLEAKTWPELAQDRPAWAAMITIMLVKTNKESIYICRLPVGSTEKLARNHACMCAR